MSQSSGIEVISSVTEKFSFSEKMSSAEEDQIVVKEKKDEEQLPSSLNNDEPDYSDGSDFGKSPRKRLSKKKRSRMIEMDDSSDEEEIDSHSSTSSLPDSKNDGDLESNIPAETLLASPKKINSDSDSETDMAVSSKIDESCSRDKNEPDTTKSSSDSDSSSDDDSPPLRIFRNKNANRSVEIGKNISEDNTLHSDDDEDEVLRPDPSEIADPQLIRKRAPARRAAMMELHSETQRLLRDSSVNLPYHRPQPKKLSEFMKRPKLGNKENENKNKTRPKKNVELGIIDELPDLGPSISDNAKIQSVVTEGLSEEADSVTTSQNTGEENGNDAKETLPKLPERPLTKRERLLKRLGSKLPQLQPQSMQKNPQFIDLDEDAQKQEQKAGMKSLFDRFMKHAKSGRKPPANKKKVVELNIVRKEERSDGSGVELVADVVKANVEEKESEESNTLSALKAANSSGERLRMLRQKLAAKMKKRREIERKKREELHKLDNEELGLDEEEEEDCDWSEAESEEEDPGEEENNSENSQNIVKSEKLGNGIIESSESEDDDDDTQPIEDSKTKETSLTDDGSLTKNASDGSVLLFEDSTRSSTSTALNKSGRVTPGFDRLCSDDSFYNSIIPLRQPEISNISNSSHFAKPQVSKGEFDDTCFESDLQSISQPFRLDFEPSQSQFLDADGFIKENSSTKHTTKNDPSSLPPGAEDDNAMTDCSMSHLLSLCSAPFNGTMSPRKGGVTQLLKSNESGVSNTQELLGLCSGNFSATPSQGENLKIEKKSEISQIIKRGDSGISNTQELLGLCSGNFADSVESQPQKDDSSVNLDVHESTRNAGDSSSVKHDTTISRGFSENEENEVSNIDEGSADLFKTAEVNESFGFSLLSGNTAGNAQEQGGRKLEENDSDADDEDDQPITIIRTKKSAKEKILKEFLEDEAELSGSDEGSGDEDDEVGPDGYESDEPVETLPAEEEMNLQLNKVHRKQLLEEDQRNLELLQEAFMGGEEIAQRERKFRWKNIDATITENILNSDDEDDHHDDVQPEGIEDSQWMKDRLEREEFLLQNDSEGLQSEDSQLLNLGRKVLLSRQNSLVALSENSNLSPAGSNGVRLSVDDSSSNTSDRKYKGRRGSFLSRSNGVLAKLANFQELKHVNGPKNSDKMLFKTVSPKQNKQAKRKKLADTSNTPIKEPPRKRKKFVVMNEDSNSVFDLM